MESEVNVESPPSSEEVYYSAREPLTFWHTREVAGGYSDLAGDPFMMGHIATAGFNFAFEDIGTMIDPDSTAEDRLMAGLFLFAKPAKLVGKGAEAFKAGDKVNDARKVDKGNEEVIREISDVPHVKEAKDVIAERTKRLDLNEHQTITKQMSSKKMKELRERIDNRTITKQEYADYIWNKKFAKRRDKGVKEFWYQEQQRILNKEPPTRNWSREQVQDILDGKTPKFDGKPIAGHHSYSASKYPHLADKGEIIYPVTFREHFIGWHGRNWRNSIPGEPIIPIKDF